MTQFLKPHEHFEELLNTLSDDALDLYDSLKHNRTEAAFRGRNFILYEIVQREPKVLDTITVLDFLGDDATGASCEVRSQQTGEVLTLRYKPVQLLDYPVFMHLPLHGKLRWSTTPDKVLGGSLAFDIVIRVASRMHMRERGVIHCEAGVDFAREFETSTS